MSYNISNLKTDLQQILNSTDLDKISNANSLIQRAARDVILDADPYETLREQQIGSPIYRDAFYYAAPSDIKGDGVVDLYEQTRQSGVGSIFNLRTSLDARVYDEDNTLAIEKINGTHFLRINKKLEDYLVLDRMLSESNYTATTNVSNIEKDTTQYVEGASSIKFDIDQVGSSTTATITGAITTADFTKYEDEGAVFLWVYMPTASGITSLTLDIGSDSSNYWSDSATTTHSGESFSDGWNLIRFDLEDATETGTVDVDAVDYYALDISYNGTAQTGLRIDYLMVSLGKIHKIKYYSKYLFKKYSDNSWTDTIESDNDTINLDTDSYNLLLYKAASYFIQHQHDFNYKPNASEDDKFEVRYRDTLKRYKARYKSERKRQQVVYYPYSQ